MSELVARVPTDRPGPYLKQLCRHFGHKMEVAFDDDSGHVTFPYGRADMDASSEAGTLVLRVTAEDDEGAARTAKVIGDHLERFGRRDGLSVDWQPA